MNEGLDSGYTLFANAAIKQSLKGQPAYVLRTTTQYPILYMLSRFWITQLASLQVDELQMIQMSHRLVKSQRIRDRSQKSIL
jgi:hypothetical protein